MESKYNPHVHQWICTCPHFFQSCFLLCKHLVQLHHPVPPIFFLQVTHNHTGPIWQHSSLLPLHPIDKEVTMESFIQPPPTSNSPEIVDKDLELDAEDDGKPDQVAEEFQGIREVLLELADMVSYNIPLKDHHALAAFQN